LYGACGQMRSDLRIAVSHLPAPMAERYLLATLVGHWRKRGLRVQVGEGYSPDADVCILHHDISRLDAEKAPPAPRDIPVVNGRVLDISKRSYSTLVLDQDDAWSGPVIIKSNLNHYGAPETRMLRRAILERVRRRLADISWRGAQSLPSRSYPILRSIEDVPAWAWSSPELLVEKFLPERTRDGFYGVRGWVFCGDLGYAYRVASDEPIVKPRTAARITYLKAPPEALMRRRKELKFDYGKFDYVEHDGEPILLDANKTPTFHGDPESQRMRWLASGIEVFLEGVT
jgi:hypothetical protein